MRGLRIFGVLLAFAGSALVVRYFGWKMLGCFFLLQWSNNIALLRVFEEKK